MRYAVLLIFFLVTAARAEETRPELANCSYYRAKREDVPVYAEKDQSSEIIGRLELGERVCGIGEMGEFALLEWDKQAILRGGAKEKERRGYVRLVELWPPPDRSERPGKESKELLGYQKTRTAPDDPIWFLRPVLDLFFTRDPCADPSRIGCPK